MSETPINEPQIEEDSQSNESSGTIIFNPTIDTDIFEDTLDETLPIQGPSLNIVPDYENASIHNQTQYDYEQETQKLPDKYKQYIRDLEQQIHEYKEASRRREEEKENEIRELQARVFDLSNEVQFEQAEAKRHINNLKQEHNKLRQAENHQYNSNLAAVRAENRTRVEQSNTQQKELHESIRDLVATVDTMQKVFTETQNDQKLRMQSLEQQFKQTQADSHKQIKALLSDVHQLQRENKSLRLDQVQKSNEIPPPIHSSSRNDAPFSENAFKPIPNTVPETRNEIGMTPNTANLHITQTPFPTLNFNQNFSEQANHTITKKKEKIPDKYDGKTPWDDYLVHFSIIAKMNNWSEEEKCQNLAISLKGAAQKMLSTRIKGQMDYKTLLQNLEDRFGCKGQTLTFRNQLTSRTQRPKESYQEYSDEMVRIAHNAYPNAPGNFADEVALDHFKKGVANAELRRTLLMDETLLTMRQTLKKANLHQSVEDTESAHVKKVHQIKEVKTFKPQNTHQNASPNNAPNKPNEKSRSPPACWNCGSHDHLAKSCPSPFNEEIFNANYSKYNAWKARKAALQADEKENVT